MCKRQSWVCREGINNEEEEVEEVEEEEIKLLEEQKKGRKRRRRRRKRMCIVLRCRIELWTVRLNFGFIDCAKIKLETMAMMVKLD